MRFGAPEALLGGQHLECPADVQNGRHSTFVVHAHGTEHSDSRDHAAGQRESHPSMKELALIGVTLALPGGLTAKIAVLGPMRMQYEKVMGAVLHIGREFSDVG